MSMTSAGVMAASNQQTLQQQPQHRVQYRPPDISQVSAGVGMQSVQPQPGFPSGAHINPQVYPNFGEYTFSTFINFRSNKQFQLKLKISL